MKKTKLIVLSLFLSIMVSAQNISFSELLEYGDNKYSQELNNDICFTREGNVLNTLNVEEINGFVLDTLLLDPRDGKSYRIVNIEGQVWMAENLAYNSSSGCWVYKNELNNISKFGYPYDWETAKRNIIEKYGYLYDWETAKKVCPSGWHLPTKNDYLKLLNNYGGRGGYKKLRCINS